MSDLSFIAAFAVSGDRPSAKPKIGLYIAAYPELGEAILQIRMASKTATLSITSEKIDRIINALDKARVEIVQHKGAVA